MIQMKTRVIYALLLFATNNCCFADDLIKEVASLDEQRNSAIEKIDKKYVEELEKVKTALTKAGDLDKALAVDFRIKSMQDQHRRGAEVEAIPERSLIGEYTYRYLSNEYEESWIIRDGGKVDFLSKRNGNRQGIWKLRNGILIVEQDSKPNYIFHFPVSSFVSMKIEGDKGSAMITKKKK